jgi:hypothetical protein
MIYPMARSALKKEMDTETTKLPRAIWGCVVSEFRTHAPSNHCNKLFSLCSKILYGNAPNNN